MIRNETTDFGALPIGANFTLDAAIIFEKTRADRGKIVSAPGQPQLRGIGPYLFGLDKPVQFVPRGTEAQ